MKSELIPVIKDGECVVVTAYRLEDSIRRLARMVVVAESSIPEPGCEDIYGVYLIHPGQVWVRVMTGMFFDDACNAAKDLAETLNRWI